MNSGMCIFKERVSTQLKDLLEVEQDLLEDILSQLLAADLVEYSEIEEYNLDSTTDFPIINWLISQIDYSDNDFSQYKFIDALFLAVIDFDSVVAVKIIECYR